MTAQVCPVQKLTDDFFYGGVCVDDLLSNWFKVVMIGSKTNLGLSPNKGYHLPKANIFSDGSIPEELYSQVLGRLLRSLAKKKKKKTVKGYVYSLELIRNWAASPSTAFTLLVPLMQSYQKRNLWIISIRDI